jgi:hypothetical protein
VDSSETEPSVIADQVAGACVMAGSLLSGLDNSVTLTAVRVAAGTDGAEDLVFEKPMATLGGAALSSLPANCAVLVHKVTARGGRRGRGRFFLPWYIGEGDVDEAGQLTTVTQTAIQGRMDTFRTGLASGGSAMVLLHDPSHPGVGSPTAPGPPNPVTALRVDKLISTQRRRLGR